MQFLAGKYLGLVATLWLQLGIMLLAFVGVSLAAGAPLGSGHAIAFGLVAVELALVVAFATLFSSLATPFLAACYSVGLYLVGHLTRDLRAIGATSESEVVKQVTVWIHRVFPDLSGLNRVVEAVHQLPIPAPEVGYALLMGLAWCVGFLLVAVVVFERRDFR
jgi:ABC-type transport system involved in multi-copper enzyme maturation permease subunit